MFKKSRTSITNTLRLLQLNSYVQQCLATDKISAGCKNYDRINFKWWTKMVCDSIVGQNFLLEETEKLVKDLKEKNEPKPQKENKILIQYSIL